MLVGKGAPGSTTTLSALPVSGRPPRPFLRAQEPMLNEVQLIADSDGIAVIGHPGAVERFLRTEGLPSRDLGLQRLGPALRSAAGLAQAGADVAATSGRWVRLTKESAEKLGKYNLMKGSERGVNRAVFTDSKGTITGLMEIVTNPAAKAMNPAVLSGAAGLMAQIAMEQAMDEITDYLATIDEKLDDVLRAQQDAVLADMIGVDLVIEEAMTVRSRVGRVSEVTWSKVQATAATVARTQAYALRQIDALAEKLERETDLGAIADAAKTAETKVQEWLTVLARCFQLHDALAVLELDRVLDSSPDELDRHRIGLSAARQDRRELILQSTAALMARMDAAADRANARVLLHPVTARSVVHAGNNVSSAVVDFQRRLGIDAERQEVAARRWADAAAEAKDRVLETGSDGVDVVRTLGSDAFGKARSATGRISGGLAERARRVRRAADAGGEEPVGSAPVADA